MDQGTDSSKRMLRREPWSNIPAQTLQDPSTSALPRGPYSETPSPSYWQQGDMAFGPISTLMTQADRSPSWPTATNSLAPPLQKGSQITSSERSTPLQRRLS